MKLISTIAFCFICIITKAQDLEPRAYANVPKGTNVIAVVYALSSGNVLTDPSLPVSELKVTADNFGLGYVHTFALANKLARIQVVAPVLLVTGKAKLNGVDTSITRNGLGDVRIRFGVNLFGSPALDR